MPSSNQGNDTVIAGTPTETGGLSWTVTDQANWGFGVKSISITNTPVYGVIRGIGLKCYFTAAGASGYANAVIGIESSDIGEVNKVATDSIDSIIGVWLIFIIYDKIKRNIKRRSIRPRYI